LGYVRDRTGIAGMGEEVAKNFREKARMKDVLRGAGVPCARHRLCTGVDEAISFAAMVGFPLVVKPPAGAGAKSTFRVDDSAALRALSALGMTSGVSHMEWFRRADGSVAISEVGARPPGAHICTLHSVACDFDFYAAWGRAVVFDEFTPPQRRYAAGAAYFR